MGFVDGFNLYHSLNFFQNANTVDEQIRYKKYKWLCLWNLIDRYVDSSLGKLVGVEYFTASPTWDAVKAARHSTYLDALVARKVRFTLGEFKKKTVKCKASCKEIFTSFEEKQTDVNISTSLIAKAPEYDVAILLTADSDQVPAVRLLKSMYPEKEAHSLPPIGRRSKELSRVCDQTYKMSEDALIACQMPSMFEVPRGNGVYRHIKPSTWP